MEQIIILGGTFNPIHYGHIELAKNAHEVYGLPILIMPSGDPSSYKSDAGIASANHRVNMIKTAIKEYDYMNISTLEIDRPGKTYTADTLNIIKDLYKKIYFIIGADSFFYIDKWYKPEYICTHCTLLVAVRDDHTNNEMLLRKKYLEEKYNAVIEFLQTPNMPYSSTQIREHVKNGIEISSMVPESVANYIKNNKLYK